MTIDLKSIDISALPPVQAAMVTNLLDMQRQMEAVNSEALAAHRDLDERQQLAILSRRLEWLKAHEDSDEAVE